MSIDSSLDKADDAALLADTVAAPDAEPVAAGAPSAEMLAESSVFLAQRNMFGMIWCDENLIAKYRFGKLAAFVPLEQDICGGLLPLMGAGEQIRALRRQPDRSYEIPNISVRNKSFTTPKFSISVYWISARKTYLVLLSRGRSALEQELAKQTRSNRLKEHALARQSRELERANRELTLVNGDLKEFGYVISHDLKAPLRALRYLSEDLEHSLTAFDADAARGQLAQIQSQTRRMSAMLSGLFEYASLGRRVLAIGPVNSQQLITEIIGSLRGNKGIEVVASGHWPVLQTLDQPLDLTLRNLIENAVKHHDRETGLITVTGHDDGDFWRVEIADDGPGIPLTFQQAVFQPFQKVATNANPDSSGVGLAIVKKAVESVGGTIELIATKEDCRGCTFKLCWPKYIEM